MATVPVRPVVELLAATLIVTVPFPVPVAPAVTVSHDAEVAAVHAQPFDAAVHPHVAPALTVIEPVDAAGGSDADTADRAGAHGEELAKAFDNSLTVDPPGPTAHILAW